MIDELLSNWWASFKVNSGSLSTRCWLSSLTVLLFQHSITFHLHQSAFLLCFHTHCCLSSPSLPLSLSCVDLFSPLVPDLTLSIQPSFSYSLASRCTNLSVSSHALSVSLSLSFLSLLFCLVQLFHSLLVFHFQAANGEQNHHDWERSLPGPEGARETVSNVVVLPLQDANTWICTQTYATKTHSFLCGCICTTENKALSHQKMPP